MIVRPYRPEDRPEVERLYKAQGFEYELPDIDAPTFFIRLVLVDDQGKIVQAAIAHLTAEIYFFMDPKEGTPEERYKNFKQLHQVGKEVAYKPGGLDDLHCWLPPRIAKSFGKRLQALGWSKALWPCFTTEV